MGSCPSMLPLPLSTTVSSPTSHTCLLYRSGLYNLPSPLSSSPELQGCGKQSQVKLISQITRSTVQKAIIKQTDKYTKINNGPMKIYEHTIKITLNIIHVTLGSTASMTLTFDIFRLYVKFSSTWVAWRLVAYDILAHNFSCYLVDHHPWCTHT